MHNVCRHREIKFTQRRVLLPDRRRELATRQLDTAACRLQQILAIKLRYGAPG